MTGKVVNNTEILVSNMLEIEAVIRILVKKGITTEDDILKEVKLLQVELEDKIKKMGQANWKNCLSVFFCF